MNETEIARQGVLGKKANFSETLNPSHLFPIPRKEKRDEINYNASLFSGEDVWTCYELSWLDASGKPHIGVITLSYSSTSEFIIESKSLKLYLNSFNFTSFNSFEEVRRQIETDLSTALKSKVNVLSCTDKKAVSYTFDPSFICVDSIESTGFSYDYSPSCLDVKKSLGTQYLYSNLLRSNCLVTNQPDWGTVFIAVKNAQIVPESFLKYIVSFRNHREFHEQCVERIAMDLYQLTGENVTVLARYTRRGGIDINPFRYNGEPDPLLFSLPKNSKQLNTKEQRQ